MPTDREKKVLNSIIWDCQMHYSLGQNMFSSMTDFLKFLYAEVMCHSMMEGGVDFEKAKEAYTSWAKKSHADEFDQLFTGFFNEILDRKKTFGGQELLTRLEGVDFRAAAEIVAYTFQEAVAKAESEGGRHIFGLKEFIDVVDQYTEKPCLERAANLLEKYPSLLGLFELTKDYLIIRMRELKKSKE
ncbi:MAG: hypothetical protein ACFFDI_16020 [Promethearchaeota archaeon]